LLWAELFGKKITTTPNTQTQSPGIEQNPGLRYNTLMKKNTHPKYHQATISCACGNSFTAGSTQDAISVDICSQCHPFYTGEQKFIDTKGRIEKFQAKQTAAASYIKKKKEVVEKREKPKTLREMLTQR